MAERTKGRPIKLTQRINADTEQTFGERIIEALRTGAYLEHACGYANIAPSTAYEWIAQGKDARAVIEEHGDDHKLTTNERAYLDFAEAVEKARSTVVVASLGVIRTAAQNGTWQAAAWYLERTQPQHFGRQQKIEIEQATVTGDAARQRLLELDLGSLADGDI